MTNIPGLGYQHWTAVVEGKGPNPPSPPCISVAGLGVLPAITKSLISVAAYTVTIEFTASGAMNGAVLGPSKQLFYRAQAELGNPNYTFITDLSGRRVGSIEWGKQTMIEIAGRIQKQSALKFVSFQSDDSRLRTMNVLGPDRYVWSFGEGGLLLYRYNANSRNYEAIAKMKHLQTNTVTLELNAIAVQAALLPVCAMAAWIFQAGSRVH
ncbi:hypothetical protein EV361DRAFT_1003785 [Lentinula raphanica]|uniref:Uncharacterized protein n=1 Tax=Lentinula raphanica TaxID=153919 RepID=A0AA38UB34_9AGAR|nr:hypothetical protein F5880DRAFT_1674626 [Lentinula raphanica]KAJ3835846.1 hypothetical protein F5878DRAFT_663508 [Lentinula raphanica]KAJ3968448.1 hypothetical protein EV361DRAFT_1003785 [Lentinula raphanica]